MTRRLSLIFTFLVTSFQLVAQTSLCTDSRYETGNFSLSKTDICHTENITITTTNDLENPLYVLNYKGESYSEAIAKATPSIAYNDIEKSGIYTVLQLSKKNGKEAVYCQDIKVRKANEPVFSYSYCPGSYLEVHIPVHQLNDYASYEIKLDNSPTQNTSTLPFSHTFNLTGFATQSLTIKGSGGAKTCNQDPAPTTISFNGIFGSDFDFLPEISQVRVLNNNDTRIDFEGDLNQSYNLYRYASTNFTPLLTPIATGLKPGTFIDQTVPNATSSYCYYVQRSNTTAPCTFIPVNRSMEICTIPLITVIKGLTQNTIRWASYRYPPFVPGAQLTPTAPIVKLHKSENNILTPPITAGLTNTSTLYNDLSVKCKNKYCYHVTVNIAGQMALMNYAGISTSNEICVDHKLNITDFPKGSFVSTENNLNEITADITNTSTYQLNRWVLYKENASGFSAYDSLNAPVASIKFTDMVAPTASETYKLRYVDECENRSDFSPQISSTFLTSNALNNLQWTSENPFSEANINQFEILYLDEVTQALKNTQTVNSTTFQFAPDISSYTNFAPFQIKSTSNSGEISYSNILKMPIRGIFFIPTAFTPNGDSINDKLEIKGTVLQVADFQMSIFTASGQKIAEIKDPNLGWNGEMINRKKAPNGYYAYKLTATMQNGEVVNQNGGFSILY